MKLPGEKRSAMLGEMEGQIRRGSKFGEIIYRIAKSPKFQTFLEIGTWNGRGSTKCFIDGLLERSDNYSFISIEDNKEFHDTAVEYWKGKANNRIQLVYGTVIRPQEIMTHEEIENHHLFPGVRDHYYQHYQLDISNASTAPLVLEKIPSEIDVLLLDGGEFSGHAEWDKFRNRGISVVLLDDVNTIKNAEVFEELKQDKSWTLVLSWRTERIGIAIFAKSNQADEVVDIVDSCLRDSSHYARSMINSKVGITRFAEITQAGKSLGHHQHHKGPPANGMDVVKEAEYRAVSLSVSAKFH
jgi:hypothetical protein